MRSKVQVQVRRQNRGQTKRSSQPRNRQPCTDRGLLERQYRSVALSVELLSNILKWLEDISDIPGAQDLIRQELEAYRLAGRLVEISARLKARGWDRRSRI